MPRAQETETSEPDIDSDPIKTLETLLAEEDLFYQYTTQSASALQRMENKRYRAWAIDFEALPLKQARFSQFARHLQICWILLRNLMRVLPSSFLFKHGDKLKHISRSCHQNFIFVVDTVMRHCESQRYIANSVDYKLLKKIATKKLNSRTNATTMLTKFRQNNELSVLNLKKIIK